MGGVPALQSVTIVMELPFSFVLVLIVVGPVKALRVEALRTAHHRQTLRSWLSGRTSEGPVRSPAGAVGGRGWIDQYEQHLEFLRIQ